MVSGITSAVYAYFGLPVQNKGQKHSANFNSFTQSIDGNIDSNIDGKVDEKDKDGVITPDEIYQEIFSHPELYSVLLGGIEEMGLDVARINTCEGEELSDKQALNAGARAREQLSAICGAKAEVAAKTVKGKVNDFAAAEENLLLAGELNSAKIFSASLILASLYTTQAILKGHDKCALKYVSVHQSWEGKCDQYLNKEALAKAEQYYLVAVENSRGGYDPDAEVLARTFLGDLSAALGRFNEAIGIYSSALAIRPFDNRAHFLAKYGICRVNVDRGARRYPWDCNLEAQGKPQNNNRSEWKIINVRRRD
jgi:tetratricopeptide (TPR) repeat protein